MTDGAAGFPRIMERSLLRGEALAGPLTSTTPLPPTMTSTSTKTITITTLPTLTMRGGGQCSCMVWRLNGVGEGHNRSLTGRGGGSPLPHFLDTGSRYAGRWSMYHPRPRLGSMPGRGPALLAMNTTTTINTTRTTTTQNHHAGQSWRDDSATGWQDSWRGMLS